MLIFRIKEDLNDLHSVDFIYIRCTQEIFLETFILSFEFLLPMLFVVAKRCYTVRLLEAWLIISCPPFFFFFFFTTTSLLVKGSDFSPRIFELFFLSLFFLLFCLFRTLSSKKLDLSRVSTIRTSGFVLEKLRLLDLCQPYNLTFVGNNALANLLIQVLYTSVHSYKKVSRILFYTLNNFI